MDIFRITLIGLFAGVVGTGLGSLISIILFRPTSILAQCSGLQAVL